jgi:hypothetical protein
MESDLRSSALAVAALCVSIVEDIDHGTTYSTAPRRQPILAEIGKVHRAKALEWGTGHLEPLEWVAILGDEYGDLCKAAIKEHGWS